MRQFVSSCMPDSKGHIALTKKEFRYLSRVLRLQSGTPIDVRLSDGRFVSMLFGADKTEPFLAAADTTAAKAIAQNTGRRSFRARTVAFSVCTESAKNRFDCASGGRMRRKPYRSRKGGIFPAFAGQNGALAAHYPRSAPAKRFADRDTYTRAARCARGRRFMVRTIRPASKRGLYAVRKTA